MSASAGGAVLVAVSFMGSSQGYRWTPPEPASPGGGSARQGGLDGRHQRRILRLHLGAEPGDLAVGRDQELLEVPGHVAVLALRSEEHTSELQSLMRISYAGFCLKKNKKHDQQNKTDIM